jgi:hypothetical protein
MKRKIWARVLAAHLAGTPRVFLCFFLFGLAQDMSRATPGTARRSFRGYYTSAIENIERCLA